MKKLAVLFVLSLPAWCAADRFSDQLTRATAHALAKSTVQVHVKLAKPVYMSDVMFRPVRGTKDTVIRTDYKEQTCTGHLSAQETHVLVLLSCVVDDKYKAAQVSVKFADGSWVKKSGKAVEMQDKFAVIRL